MIGQSPLRTVRGQIRSLIGTDADRSEPTDYERAILHGLQFKQTYQGTVDPTMVAERRRRNKAARRARRHERLGKR